MAERRPGVIGMIDNPEWRNSNMKRCTHARWALGFAAFLTGAAVALTGPGETSAIKCPVSGEPANLYTSLATDNGPVFFCCDHCIKDYQAAPDKFTEAAAEQQKALSNREKIQVTCPVSGKPVAPNTARTFDGQSVSFCCEKCPDKYAAAPAEYKKALANSYTYQTVCPVSGKPISAASSVTVTSGETVYLCCKMCIGKFKEDSAKYTDNLLSQGYHLNAPKHP